MYFTLYNQNTTESIFVAIQLNKTNLAENQSKSSHKNAIIKEIVECITENI